MCEDLDELAKKGSEAHLLHNLYAYELELLGVTGTALKEEQEKKLKEEQVKKLHEEQDNKLNKVQEEVAN